MERGGRGVFYLVVEANEGQSAAIMPAVRRKMRSDGCVSIPRRVITHPIGSGDELYQSVTPAQFQDLRRGGAFAFVWSCDGRNFALPASVRADLEAGKAVVAAVAASAVAEALECFERVVLAVTPETIDTVDVASLLACEDVLNLSSTSADAAVDALKVHLQGAMPALPPVTTRYLPQLPA